jgi:hypothetical protein
LFLFFILLLFFISLVEFLTIYFTNFFLFCQTKFFFSNLISNFFPHLFYLHIFMNVRDYVYMGGFFILNKLFFIIKKNNKKSFFFKNTFKYFDSRMAKFLKNKLYLYNLSMLRKNHKNSFFLFFILHAYWIS